MGNEGIMRGIIEGMARVDARLFVEEFGEAIDPAATDWDATAWGERLAELRRSDWSKEDLEQDWLFPHYQGWLVRVTERLAAETDD